MVAVSTKPQQARVPAQKAAQQVPAKADAGAESAWERGLKQAREMIKKADEKKRKDLDFEEEKRINMPMDTVDADLRDDREQTPSRLDRPGPIRSSDSSNYGRLSPPISRRDPVQLMQEAFVEKFDSDRTPARSGPKMNSERKAPYFQRDPPPQPSFRQQPMMQQQRNFTRSQKYVNPNINLNGSRPSIRDQLIRRKIAITVRLTNADKNSIILKTRTDCYRRTKASNGATRGCVCRNTRAPLAAVSVTIMSLASIVPREIPRIIADGRTVTVRRRVDRRIRPRVQFQAGPAPRGQKRQNIEATAFGFQTASGTCEAPLDIIELWLIFDRKPVLIPGNLSRGIEYLFASYFAFDLAYPEVLHPTYQFLELFFELPNAMRTKVRVCSSVAIEHKGDIDRTVENGDSI